MILDKLIARGLIHPPRWLASNVQLLTVMGSAAYGVSSDASDHDIYGFTMPPKELVFPHLAGEIPGFGRQQQRFEVWQEHHIRSDDKEYDFSIYGIVKFFSLCLENNPNMIDCLFVPRRCILHSTKISEHVLDNRKKFLHKGAWFKFKGYAYQQINKYRPERREALKSVYAFRNTHSIQNSDSINNLRNELTRRGLLNGKHDTRFNGASIWPADGTETSE